MTAPVLGPWQVEIGGLVIGDGTGYRLFAFDVDKPDATTHDTNLPREDGQRFGKDFLKGNLATLEFGIDKGNDADALAALAALRKVWLGDSVRLTAGAVTTLRYQVANGETRKLYGRPRKFAPGKLDTAATGYIDVTADFQCADHRFYADTDAQSTYQLNSSTDSGFTSPLVAPISTSAVTFVPGTVSVSGDEPSWLVATVRAGTSQLVVPVIEAVGLWSITLEAVLQPGEYITIDSRPWVRSVTRNGVANAAGLFSQSSPRLSQMLIQPGKQEIVLRGTDVSGTATLELSTTDAYASL